MPLTTAYANDYLDFLLAKKTSMTVPSQVWMGLCSNDPEADKGAITELSGGGYTRVLISQKGAAYPDFVGSSASRAITNTKQINWAKATADWKRVNGFFLSASGVVGETTQIFFYGKLELSAADATAGGLLVEAGSVALFDPEAFKIRFSVSDATSGTVSGTVIYADQSVSGFEPSVQFTSDTDVYYEAAVSADAFTLQIGKTYTVVFDGTSYKCIAQDASAMFNGAVVIGNAEFIGMSGNGEPFAIAYTPVEIIIGAINNTEATHSVVIYEE